MKAVLYTQPDCMECERARTLLSHLNIDCLEYSLGKDFIDRQFFREFGENSSYPQVAIDYKHIGGMKDLLRYLKDKQLI